MSVSATVPSPTTRDRSIEARRAARLKKFERERLVIDYLNRGVSVAEIAMRLDVTEKRMRTIVREALTSYLPAPPEEFVAMQIASGGL
jgi:transposase-like protein